MKLDKETLKKDLKEGIYNITFEKVDGSIREMVCTLRPEYLPVISEDHKTNPHKENPDVLSVWDIDKSGWRSMRIENIKNVEKEI